MLRVLSETLTEPDVSSQLAICAYTHVFTSSSTRDVDCLAGGAMRSVKGFVFLRVCCFLEVAVGGGRGSGGANTSDVVSVRGILVVTGAMTCLFALVLNFPISNPGGTMGTDSHGRRARVKDYGRGEGDGGTKPRGSVPAQCGGGPF